MNKIAWCAIENNIYCGRLDIVMGGGEFGNPYKVAQYGRDRAIELFKMNTLQISPPSKSRDLEKRISWVVIVPLVNNATQIY